MTNVKEIEIRSLHLIEEMEEVRKLESSIWGEEDSIPTHQTITAVKNGGLVLGAYDEDKLVGFQYSFPGFDGEAFYLCSHMLGIDPDYRNKGIGRLLKKAQRDEALKLGYSLITWTYDPLESINGYLNIAKLGGIVSKYIENCYGEMEDLLNSGIASDRFLVEWQIQSEEVLNCEINEIELEDVMTRSLIQWDMNQDGLPIPTSCLTVSEDKITFVAIPKDFRTIRETNIELAINWRMTTRNVFSNLFANGWRVTSFHKNTLDDIPVQFYVLTK